MLKIACNYRILQINNFAGKNVGPMVTKSFRCRQCEGEGGLFKSVSYFLPLNMALDRCLI